MSLIPPRIRRPTVEEIKELAAKHHMSLSSEEIATFQELIDISLEAYEGLDEFPEPRQERRYTDRDPGYRPTSEEDPLNAFVRKCHIEGSDDGPLAGYEIGLKDNIAIAGIEMTCGSRPLAGYVPSEDATIVERLLDAGGTIVGKLNMEDMAYSGTGELSATGPVYNPRNTQYLAGGSSSGSAAAVVAGDVDLAIGGDQGGSIRIPAAWSGCVGLKPTHGLVPYTGIIGIDPTIDHTGPMAINVDDCARALEVIAGKDPLDPRQRDIDTVSYEDELTDDPSDISVGVLTDGFEFEQSEQAIDDAVWDAINEFEKAGAAIQTVSVPEHEHGMAILDAIAAEGMVSLVRNDGLPRFVEGNYSVEFAQAFGGARRTQANDFPPTLKLILVLGEYLAQCYKGTYYAKAQNLKRELAKAYDEAFADVDVLAMPTLPYSPPEVNPDLTLKELLERQLDMRPNTAPYDATGHPAISVPCGTVNDLPVGLMFVGEQFADDTVLAAAYAFEQSVGWDL